MCHGQNGESVAHCHHQTYPPNCSTTQTLTLKVSDARRDAPVARMTQADFDHTIC